MINRGIKQVTNDFGLFAKKVFCFSLVLFLSFIFLKPLFWKHNLEVIVQDVGQGDSILIKTPLSQNILVDTSYSPGILKQALSKNISLGDSTIDYLILTHHDKDHIGGLSYILENFNVRFLIDPRSMGMSQDSVKEDVERMIWKNKIPVLPIFSDSDLEIEPGVILDFIMPDSVTAVAWNSFKSSNKSVTFILRYGDNSFYFGGDNEKDAEIAILKLPFDLKSEYYKVSHHGSKTSSIWEFLEANNSKFAMISYGKNNRFGHPHKEVTDRFNDFGIKWFGTGGGGDVIIECDLRECF